MLEFSVIVPTYKRPELLRSCLEAMAPERQGVAPDRYEVIVCDDEASEETRGVVLRSLAGAVYTVGPRKGPAANRNHGARLAQGRWLVLTDDDCIPCAGWLAAFANALRPDCLVYEGRTTCAEGLLSPLEYAPINETGGYLWSCNFIIDSSLFRSLGGFDEGFPHAAMEDVDFRERLTDHGFGWNFVPEAAINHPPRTLRLSTLLAGHESYYYYLIVRCGTIPKLWRVLMNIAKTRVKAFFRPVWWRDLPKAVSLIVAELASVCFYHHPWRTKFSAAAPDSVRQSNQTHRQVIVQEGSGFADADGPRVARFTPSSSRKS